MAYFKLRHVVRPHIFKYDGHYYMVNNLVDFTKDKETKEIVLPDAFLKEYTLEQIWCKHIPNTDKKEPMTFMDLTKHIKKIYEADYKNYPIIAVDSDDDEHQSRILDGWHRVLHAYMDGATSISAYLLTPDDMTEFTKTTTPYE